MKKFLALFSIFLLSVFSVQTVLAEDEDDEDEYEYDEDEYEYENDEEDEDEVNTQPEVTPIIEITTPPETTTIKQVVIPDIVVTDDNENGIVDAVEELFYK